MKIFPKSWAETEKRLPRLKLRSGARALVYIYLYLYLYFILVLFDTGFPPPRHITYLFSASFLHFLGTPLPPCLSKYILYMMFPKPKTYHETSIRSMCMMYCPVATTTTTTTIPLRSHPRCPINVITYTRSERVASRTRFVRLAFFHTHTHTRPTPSPSIE